ncbi:hypothetical protein RINTHH_16550 [Richelia intracellularis HH01]|uniref:TIGR04376 family protein n=1 Tax=Richelia intracellularis HH01 TaxID=1165094 RepID=M1X320_9NOST|nr:TIGR04376 family protein [Richelia intracellularis]CCH67810.1 hypothetical protein RINTHH_16550 [Richelia intracellularis HH01]
MPLFDDLSQFLENRLEEFLRRNPHLELEVLLEQLRIQEEDTLKLIAELKVKEQQSQDETLSTAQEIHRWHIRIQKAKNANRPDLANAAQEREASLLHQGNLLWGQMQGLKERLSYAQALLHRIQIRHQEVKAKATEVQAKRISTKAQNKVQQCDAAGWSSTNGFYSSNDNLEEKFRRWETEAELEQMKRNMGK